MLAVSITANGKVMFLAAKSEKQVTDAWELLRRLINSDGPW